MTQDEKVEKIAKRVFHQYVNQYADQYRDWRSEWVRGDARLRIKELLEQGYKVTGGYYATAVKGYHDYRIFYKGKK